MCLYCNAFPGLKHRLPGVETLLRWGWNATALGLKRYRGGDGALSCREQSNALFCVRLLPISAESPTFARNNKWEFNYVFTMARR